MTHFPEMIASVLDSCQQELELLRKEFVCSKVNDARSAVYSEFSRKLELMNSRIHTETCKRQRKGYTSWTELARQFVITT